MEFKLTRPCSNCPFRTDKFFYLNKNRKEEIATSLLFGDKTFICHKTTNGKWDEEYENYEAGGEEQHCAGALIILSKMGILWNNFMFRLAHISKLFNPDKLKMDSPVYETMQEFVDAKQE